MNKNHIFSFAGGEELAKMGAWWFVSYSYYLYVDRSHLDWRSVGTENTRRTVYNRTRKYHAYWLCEVEDMERLDVHGNSAGLPSEKIKSMASKVLSVISKDNGKSEIEAILNELIEKRDGLMR